MGTGKGLFYHKGLYDVEKTNDAFLKAVQKNVEFHKKHCEEYAQILSIMDFSASDLKSIDDLHKIPPLPTLFLKSHPLLSVSPKRMILKSTTSGTSGKFTSVGFDRTSSIRGLGMIIGTFLTHRLVSPRLTNYIVLGYQPAKHNKMGAVKTAYATTFAAPAFHREYALKDTGTGYKLNIDGIKNALIRYEKQGLPVRFMGFPPYFMFLLKELRESGIKLKLHKKSMVLLAGGWKQFLSEQVDKEVLYAQAEEILNIKEDRIREFFGAVEHPIAYFNCKNHHFHVPVYSRVIIRDHISLEPVDFGTPGLLNLITPMLTSMPYTSVMTDDVAVMYRGEQCGCGITSPYFEVLGRSGLADIKTCSAGAAELLKSIQKEA